MRRSASVRLRAGHSCRTIHSCAQNCFRPTKIPGRTVMATKHLVVGVDWYGPYSLLQAQRIAHEYGKGGLYLCLGKRKGQHLRTLQYVGKSNGGLRSRLQRDHHKLRLVTRDQQLWLGVIATGNVPGKKKLVTPQALRMAEWALAHFLRLRLNDRLRERLPPSPVTVLNRWWADVNQERPRYRRPHGDWPDLIDFIGPSYRTRLVWFGSPGRQRTISAAEL
jgi:hypothetical protein